MSAEEGGTRIRRNKQQGQQQVPPQQQQEQAMQQQLYQQQLYEQQQMEQQQKVFEQQKYAAQEQIVPRGILKKTSFSVSDPSFKEAVLVAIIFVLLNSKIIWSQILKLPFMGGIEPSIMALLVNSILAAIVFYIVSKVM
jgi:hypothetical protein